MYGQLCLPMNRSGKIHALLSTARIANLPSVVCNVWVGVALGTLMSSYAGGQTVSIPWISAASTTFAGMLLYVGGNFFNDWMDRAWDAEHRPERALPRGLFPSHLYAVLALFLIGAGVSLAWAASWRSAIVAMILVFWIVVYTVFHKRSAWAVIPMGLCRALLPMMGYLAIYPYINMIWPAASGLFFYIVGLSLSARYESMKEPPMRVAVMARGLLLATAVALALSNRIFYLERLPSLMASIPYLVWTGVCLRFRRRPVTKFVSSLLAGIPLVDWMALLPIFLTFVNDGHRGTGAFTIGCLVIPPFAFIAAHLLQRLAPAT